MKVDLIAHTVIHTRFENVSPFRDQGDADDMDTLVEFAGHVLRRLKDIAPHSFSDVQA